MFEIGEFAERAGTNPKRAASESQPKYEKSTIEPPRWWAPFCASPDGSSRSMAGFRSVAERRRSLDGKVKCGSSSGVGG